MVNIAIFASGNGTNAENITRYFKNSNTVKVATLFTGNPKAGVLSRMEPYGVPCRIFSREQWNDPIDIVNELHRLDISLIVLAGFMSMAQSAGESVNALMAEIPTATASVIPNCV